IPTAHRVRGAFIHVKVLDGLGRQLEVVVPGLCVALLVRIAHRSVPLWAVNECARGVPYNRAPFGIVHIGWSLPPRTPSALSRSGSRSSIVSASTRSATGSRCSADSRRCCLDRSSIPP